MANNKKGFFEANEKNYTKPGDDKIVSGKGFLISMPSLKKNNPVKSLLGGAKDVNGDAKGKNDAKNKDVNTAAGSAKQAGEKDSKVSDTSFAKNGRNNGKKPVHPKNEGKSVDTKADTNASKHPDKKHGRNNDRGRNSTGSAENTQVNAPSAAKNLNPDAKHEGEGARDRNRSRRNDRRRPAGKDTSAKQVAAENAKAEVNAKHESGKTAKGEEVVARPASKHARDKNRHGEKKPSNKEALNAKETAQVKEPAPQVHPSEKDRNHRRNGRNQGKGQAKEVNSAQTLQTVGDVENATKENAPSKNVGRIDSTLISASRPMGRKESSVFGAGIFGDKTVMSSAKAEPEEEPVYVDKSRPLSEQILEDMAKRRGPLKPVSVMDTDEKTEIVGIRFRNSGKIYYFAPGDVKVEAGDNVVVETARGVEYGFVAIGNTYVRNSKIVSPLKPVVRKATAQDTETYNLHRIFEKMSEHFFRYQVENLGLEMALVYVEYTFDASKIIFYFTADGRVDFRELIKELAAGYRTRIELRQIGVRDEAKLIGGLGICGRPICCNSFLSEFSQVSIKMAKDQNLFLNSSKISGTCGRFMCCLKFEDESYRKEFEATPKAGDIVMTAKGKGTVMQSNAIRGIVSVLLESGEEELPIEFSRDDVEVIGSTAPEGLIVEDLDINTLEDDPPVKKAKKYAENEQVTRDSKAEESDKKAQADTKSVAQKADVKADNADTESKTQADGDVTTDADTVTVDVENADTVSGKSSEVSEMATADTNTDTSSEVSADTVEDKQADKAPVEALQDTKSDADADVDADASEKSFIAVSENNIVVIDEAEVKVDLSAYKSGDTDEVVTKDTTPVKSEGIAFADGVVTVAEEDLFGTSVAETEPARSEEKSDDFVVSTESGSKSVAFADGVITIEE